MKCMDLPPRMGPRWWRNTSIQAKASIMCRYRDEVKQKLKTLLSDYLTNY